MQERLQKVIASSTSFSRRKAEELIVAGKVRVNDTVVSTLGTKVDPEKDSIIMNGKRLPRYIVLRYIILNKPFGYVCTRAQHKNEKTVYDLIPNSRDLVIAGRLDEDSEGLVLLTNDGELVNMLTHPKYKHEKEYEVVVNKTLMQKDLSKLEHGIPLEEGMAKADQLHQVDNITLRLVLHQGWNRQIRRMFGKLGYSVIVLRRIRIGNLQLDNLPLGKFREVTKKEILSK